MLDASPCDKATAFEPFRVLRSKSIVLPQDDIDTDQIFPARFMATTLRTGLGEKLFHDWRHDAAGELSADHILNRVDRNSHRILVAGRNFGSGSSREHAPWAMVDFGLRAVVAPSIADIFKSNAVQNGLLPIVVPASTAAIIVDSPGAEMVIDLERLKLVVESLDLEQSFDIEPFARRCLMDGRDALGWLTDQLPQIVTYEETSMVR